MDYKCWLVLWRPNASLCRLRWECEGNSRTFSCGVFSSQWARGMAIDSQWLSWKWPKIKIEIKTILKPRWIPGQGFWQFSFLGWISSWGSWRVHSVFWQFYSQCPIPLPTPKLGGKKLVWKSSSYFARCFLAPQICNNRWWEEGGRRGLKWKLSTWL